MANKNLKPKNLTSKHYEDDNHDIISQGEISIGFKSESGGVNTTINQIDEVLEMIINGDAYPYGKDRANEVSSTLDLIQVQILKIKLLIGLERYADAYQYLVDTFSSTLHKACSIEIYILEAELTLKYLGDHGKAKSILEKVLDEDKLNSRALLLISEILILYEGQYQQALDHLLLCKMLSGGTCHQVWNLLGHAYGFIDGVCDKAEECFMQASIVQLETNDSRQMLDLIPYIV